VPTWQEGWDQDDDEEEETNILNAFGRKTAILINSTEEKEKNREENKEDDTEDITEDDMFAFFEKIREEDILANRGFNVTRKKMGGNKKLHVQLENTNSTPGPSKYLLKGEEGDRGQQGVPFVSTPRFDYLVKDDRRRNPGPGRYDPLENDNVTNVWLSSRERRKWAKQECTDFRERTKRFFTIKEEMK
jgi:hypothetical protein